MKYLGYLKSYKVEQLENESNTSRLVMNLVLSNDNTNAFILEAKYETKILVLYTCHRKFCMYKWSKYFPIVLKHNDLGGQEYSNVPLCYSLQIPLYNVSQDTVVIP